MSVSLLEMLENLSYNTRLGDEADYPELASASVTKERVDFVRRSFHTAPPAAGLELVVEEVRLNPELPDERFALPPSLRSGTPD